MPRPIWPFSRTSLQNLWQKVRGLAQRSLQTRKYGYTGFLRGRAREVRKLFSLLYEQVRPTV